MKYVACCSGGKDSVASIILAHENKEPLDIIVFSEIMFDEKISGEFPEHIEFINNRLRPLFESWGYRFVIVRSGKTYKDMFYHTLERSKYSERIGKISGFPIAGKCCINRDLKVKPIKEYLKSLGNCIEYIGIAKDEPKRLSRLKSNQVSLLNKYGYTEEMAKDLCEKYKLLSPIYRYTKRGGCWFCMNATKMQLKNIFLSHRQLWDELLRLEKVPDKIGDMWNARAKKRITDIDKEFKKEENP